MIPSVVSRQVQRGIEDFLRTTFPITTPEFAPVLDHLIATPDMLFRGPYLSVKLPFRPAEPGPSLFPEVVPPGWNPYRHQQAAFRRLSTRSGRSTIVATGTGSGKTECFLYPILDHCLRERGRRGIKAILIYPMNALATDQAQRIAAAIAANPELRPYVTAGLYIGGKQEEASSAMSASQVITHRDTLLTHPPDILITNYKMLDYLLVRPRDARLWRLNAPDTLRYLVVDELHTFDGAQGADLACLLRRLKERLKTPEGQLICVGTSATLGESGAGTLLPYARQLFREPFDEEAVITEDLLSVDEFLAGQLVTRFQVPGPESAATLDPLSYGSLEEYQSAQRLRWFGNADEDLAIALPQHWFFRNLITILGARAVSLAGLIAELKKTIPSFGAHAEDYLGNLLSSFLSLISLARSGSHPFVQVRMQLWLRELRRMVALVQRQPVLAFADDLKPEERRRSLPLIHCRECGISGWAGLQRHGETRIDADLQAFYAAYFAEDPSPNIVFLYPTQPEEAGAQIKIGTLLCPECLTVHHATTLAPCPNCGKSEDEQIPVDRPDVTVRRKRAGKEVVVSTKDCPFCKGHSTVSFLGSRAASLTSVAISQLFASPFHPDKKLLTFSDSVQDASHRAGFFGARTYTFTLRAALQQAVQDAREPIPLPDLLAAFLRYWQPRISESQFIANFLPQDMDWLNDYRALRDTGSLPAGSDLPGMLQHRLDWEFWSEYTFDSRIGRTLEKSGCSTLTVLPQPWNAAVDKLLERLREHVGSLREVDRPAVEAFLLGLLQHLKNNGGVFGPALRAYIESFGFAGLLGKRYGQAPWRPNFSVSARAPVFLTNRSGENFPTVLSAPNANSRTWYEDWLLRCFGPIAGPGLEKDLAIIFPEIFTALTASGLFLTASAKGAPVWGINPAVLAVTTQVAQLRCARCAAALSVAAEQAPLLVGRPCLRYRCGGRLDTSSSSDVYYRNLYSAGDVQRIFAVEHTGLLERDVRERIEKQFRHPSLPGDPNLLSCTPTLEMGINIGDLSSLALCSVPPKSSNYLQRVGRAGRVDGNSFILTVANGRPHDLFFYFEPAEMIQGLVESPGCFLNASAVLERQFTAFVFDRWVETGIPETALPDDLRPVLDAVESGNRKLGFPASVLSFFENNRASLEDAFLALFGEEMQNYTRERIREFSQGVTIGILGLVECIWAGLQRLVDERKSLKTRIDVLTRRIAAIKADAARQKGHAEEIDLLLRERAALQQLRKSINERPLLNFFTDEGLLPNYAFPEAGVILRSVIYRRNTKSQDDDKKWITTSYEYERPASAAISELAPANSFHAEGRKLPIDQVNLQLSAFEPWRFCDNCAYLEREGDSRPACPRCGSNLWADGGQRRTMLRMKQVICTLSEEESRSYDESDDREPNFYQRNMFVTKNDADITAAYALTKENVPFGFEFFSRVSLREVNLGESRRENSPIVRIAGRDFKDTPFHICGGCGKVKRPREPLEHALYCKYSGKEEKAEFLDACYLYREFHSEAIRILLPIASFEIDRNVSSFVAALDLGLRRRFLGDPGHLLTTLSDEPIPGSDVRKQFLVLYDGVPGGTGYLKDLMRSPDSLMEVFEKAYEVLQKCGCQHDADKDGCYRCLLAYRGRHDQNNTSRRAAIELLQMILENRSTLKETKKLDTIGLNTLLESTLERQFIEALRRTPPGEPARQVEHQVVNGKPGFYLKFATQAYRIEPQVEVGHLQGVAVESRVDFVIYPERPSPGELPIAIFADGFEYHADPLNHMRVDIDSAQRLAITRSGRFRVWSVTWDDVLSYGAQPPRNYSFAALPPAPQFAALMRALAGADAARFARLTERSSFSLLMQLLAEGGTVSWAPVAQAFAVSQLKPNPASPGELVLDYQSTFPDQAPLLRATAGLPTSALSSRDFSALTFRITLSDDYAHRDVELWKRTWRDFLWLSNLLQFLPGFQAVTALALSSDLYPDLDSSPMPPANGALLALLDLVAPEVFPLCHSLAAAGLPLPQAGFELDAADGEILAQAELAWPALRIALLLPQEESAASVFVEHGWQPVAFASLSPTFTELFGLLSADQ